MRDQIIEYCAIDHDLESLFIGDEYDHCLIGVCFSGSEFSSAYSLNKILDFLVNDKNLTKNQAIEFFNNEIMDKNPIISFIEETNDTPDELSDYNNDMLFLNDYPSNCLIGVRFRKDEKIVSVYDDTACVESLMNDGMSEDDAIEYFEFNTRGSYVGEDTPTFITLL